MLEAAMFGGIPEGTGFRIPFAPHHLMQNGQNRNEDPYAWRMPRPPSPSLAAQRLLREQQVCFCALSGAVIGFQSSILLYIFWHDYACRMMSTLLHCKRTEKRN